MVILLFIVFFACILIFVEYYSRKIEYNDNGIKLAHVPPGQYIFGHMNILKPNKIIPEFAKLRQLYGRCNDLYVFGRRFRIIAEPTLARELFLKRPKIFRRPRLFEPPFKAMNMPTNLFIAEGNIWNKVRKLTSPQFSHLNTKLMLNRVVDEAKVLVNSFETNNQEVHQIAIDFNMYTSRVIGRVALGMSPNDKSEYFASKHIFNDIGKLLKYALERSLYMLPGWTWPYSSMYYTEGEALLSAANVDKHCMQHIKRIKEGLENKQACGTNGSGDDKSCFIEMLIKNNERVVKEGKEGITEAELVENVKLLFVAGSETTSTTLTWASYYLATRNDCLEKLRDELDRVCGVKEYIQNYEQYSALKYVHAFIKETVRLKSPAAFIGLELVRGEGSQEYTCATNGMHISGNDTVFIDIDGCLLDPEVYETPLEFNPDRWLPHGDEEVSCERLEKMEHNFLAFGSGPRQCPGMELAFMEAIIGVASIAAFLNLELGCPQKEIVRVLKFTAGANQMPMIVTERIV